MARPVILTVDDDVSVSQAIARDLRTRYSERYRIIRAIRSGGPDDARGARSTRCRCGSDPVGSSDAGDDRHRVPRRAPTARPGGQVAAPHRIRRHRRGDQGDQRHRARSLPDEAVGPPEERLYPVLDDLLDAWDRANGQRFDGVRVVGNRWSERSYETRMFLPGTTCRTSGSSWNATRRPNASMPCSARRTSDFPGAAARWHGGARRRPRSTWPARSGSTPPPNQRCTTS